MAKVLVGIQDENLEELMNTLLTRIDQLEKKVEELPSIVIGEDKIVSTQQDIVRRVEELESKVEDLDDRMDIVESDKQDEDQVREAIDEAVDELRITRS